MKPKTLLTVSSIYMGLIGLGYLLFPANMMEGVEPGAPAALLGEIRVVSSTFLGISVMNWWARSAGPSKGLDAIFVGNTLGAGLAGVLDIFEVLGGGPAYGIAFVLINLLLSAAFAWVGWKNRSANPSLTMDQSPGA